MRAFGISCLMALLAAGVTGCGGGKTEQAKQAADAAQQAAKEVAGGGGGDAAKGMQEFAKAMEQMQQSPDGKEYEPVAFKTLETLLPEYPGWEKAKPEGESMTSPMKFSKTGTSYTKDDARIELEIVDTAMAQMMTLPYQMFMASGYSKETSSGYEKAAPLAGNPGWEKWDSESKHAELGAIVGKRFLVKIEGSDTDMATVKGLAAKVDFARLAGLK
jgi:hypothetical protein